ncbi:hypothetical protein [Xylanibacter ruminicola]|uniref:hypothetical protein n=1 Tax=Xylanibacter ruminicola TaxID=839 RepID=UPI00068A58BC|nr:hypothetical protein [Xylanibacter ruminicola]
MDKSEYNELVKFEVYEFYESFLHRRLSWIDKIRAKYISPQGNATYLIRKMQYFYSCGGIKRMLALMIKVKLARRYGIYIDPQTVIGKGLSIPHPSSIVIAHTKIGCNFTIYQNCTIGHKMGKGNQKWCVPVIGDNVTMYTNSSIVGGGMIADDVTLAAHCCIVKDALESGVYVGCPGRLLNKE